jgi:hypothetical protein
LAVILLGESLYWQAARLLVHQLGGRKLAEPLIFIDFRGSLKNCPFREALKNPIHGLSSPDVAMALGWLMRRNGGCSEPP